MMREQKKCQRGSINYNSKFIEIIKQNFIERDLDGKDAVAEFNRMPGSVARIYNPSLSNILRRGMLLTPGTSMPYS